MKKSVPDTLEEIYMLKEKTTALIIALTLSLSAYGDKNTESVKLTPSEIKPKYSRESIVLGLRKLWLHYYSYNTLRDYENILAVFSDEVVRETREAHGHIVPSYVLASGYSLSETINAVKWQVNLEDKSTLGVTVFKRESVRSYIFENLLKIDSEVILEPGDLLVFTRVLKEDIK